MHLLPPASGRGVTEADDPDPSDRRWDLDVRGRAQRQPSQLPEKMATAVAEFITGPLLDTRSTSGICFARSTCGTTVSDVPSPA